MRKKLITAGTVIAALVAVVEGHAQEKAHTKQIVTFAFYKAVTAVDLPPVSMKRTVTIAPLVDGKAPVKAFSLCQPFLSDPAFPSHTFQARSPRENFLLTISD